jgi:hypothetical protein
MTSALFIKTSSFGTSSDALKISVAARSLAMDDRLSSNDLVKQMGATCLMSAAAQQMRGQCEVRGRWV